MINNVTKKTSRVRRRTKARKHMQRMRVTRLCIHRTSKHIYAQVISADGSQVLASASTLDKDLRTKVKYTGNVDAAKQVGELVAKRAVKGGVKQVAFDRSGFQYHGRVQALADAAREAGLEF